jgi:uncharacterized protein involved in outer membrane biogenesis
MATAASRDPGALPRRPKALPAILVVVVAYGLAGFLVVPLVVRHLGVTRLGAALQRPVRIQRVRFNPFNLRLAVEGLTVADAASGEPFLGCSALLVDFQAVSLLKRAPVAREVRLRGPYVHVVRRADGSFNIAELLPCETSATQPPDPPAPGRRRYALHNIQISGGTIRFQDDATRTFHRATDVVLTLPSLANFPMRLDTFVEPHFSALIDGTRVEMQGQDQPRADAPETVFNLELSGVDLPHYLGYLPATAAVGIRSGRLDLAARVTYTRHGDGRHAVALSGRLGLKDLSLHDADRQPLLDLAALELTVAAADLLGGDLRLGALTLQGPVVTIRRRPLDRQARPRDDLPPGEIFRRLGLAPPRVYLKRLRLADGRVRFDDRTAVAGTQAPQDEILLLPELTVEGLRLDLGAQSLAIRDLAAPGGRLRLGRLADGSLEAAGPAGPAASPPPPAAAVDPVWQVDVGQAVLSGWTVDGRGLRKDNPGAGLLLEDLRLAAYELSTTPRSRARLEIDCRIHPGGRLQAAADFSPRPFSAGVDLILENLDLARIGPLVPERLDLAVTGGRLSISGRMIARAAGHGPLQGDFSGRVVVRDFTSLDRRRSEDLLRWASLEVNGLELGWTPLAVDVADVVLEHPYARVVIDDTGRLNLAALAAGRPPGKPEDAPRPQEARAAEPPLPITIRRIRVRDGQLAFADQSVSPHYRAHLTAIQASMADLASEPSARATVALKGLLNGQAPVEIKGRFNPLTREPLLDLALASRDMDLPSMSPYAAKLIGRRIRKGTLALDLDYRLTRQRLEARHEVRMHHLVFGDPVPSKAAVKGPLDLAVALLQDRQGQIRFRLPVDGRIDDPAFSLAGLVRQSLTDLLAKAAASPFALIEGLAESGDPRRLVFAPGSAAPAPETRARLAALAAAMVDRPVLRLEIAGFADPVRDPPGLAETLFQHKLKAQKSPGGAAGRSLEAVTVGAEEFPALVQKAYEAETFEKPRNFFGFTRTLPPDQAEALIRRHIRVAPADLTDLARRRAEAVRNTLLASGRLAPERVVLVNPGRLQPEPVAGLPDHRVEVVPR